MNIEPNNEGWSFDKSVAWKLIHGGNIIIFFEQSDDAISTQEQLFIGTQEECQNEIERLGLIYPHEMAIRDATVHETIID
jgi:hypothetical protein